jgi:hypothetical protein
MDEFSTPFSEPMTVQVIEGEIVVLGPDGVAVSMTVEAAAESARRLSQAVEAAPRDGQPPAKVDGTRLPPSH